jgi:hypothetical protein
VSPTATWPDRAQYQDSVEAPQHSFDDPELRGATFARGNWGLMAWSGARAIVFRAVDSTGKSTAVRFLLNRDPEAGTRYETLARHLSSNPIPAFAQTSWLPDGLKIAGARYPLLKMEWVDGLPMDRFITDSLASPTARADLRAVAQAWAHSCHSLRTSGVSHGDVHAGNTLVLAPAGGPIQVRLVDYDNVWVPGLNTPCREIGNAAFQHPAYRELSVGPDRDALPNTLTYLSLIGVANDPALWIHHGENDDTLLFAHTDLEEPSSQVWEGLLGSSDPQVVAVAELTVGWLKGSPDQIRSLDQVIATTAAQIPGQRAGHGPNTWRSHTGGQGTRPWPPAQPSGPPAPSAPPAPGRPATAVPIGPVHGSQTWAPRPAPGWRPVPAATQRTPPVPPNPVPVAPSRSGGRGAILLVLLAVLVVIVLVTLLVSGGQPPG